MNKYLDVCIAIVIVLTSSGVLAVPSADQGAEVAVGRGVSVYGDKLMVNFRDPAPAADFVKPIAMASGLKVVVDEDVGNIKVGVAFDQPLSPPQAYAALVDALEAQELRIVHDGQILHIARCIDGICVRPKAHVTLKATDLTQLNPASRQPPR